MCLNSFVEKILNKTAINIHEHYVIFAIININLNGFLSNEINY